MAINFVDGKYVDEKGILKLDFGESYRTGEAVFDVLLPKFPTTLKLAIFSVIVTALVGIPLGIVSAVRQYSKLDISLTVSSLILASVPGFWLSLMMILLFSVLLGILPSSGYTTWQHYVMPVLGISLPAAAYQARITRNQMLETMRQDYIRTARAKGLKEKVVINKHAFRNTLIPLVTTLAGLLPSLFSGAIITEQVFDLPGIGNIALDAMNRGDIPFIMGYNMFLAVLSVLGVLLADLMYAVVDPRVKLE